MEPTEIKAALSHTWPIFFARHGGFTQVQQEAIPPILDGQNTLLVAATASGKTEAVIAPLLERTVCGDTAWLHTQPELRILYICPTRALVRDLFERLALPLERLQVTLAHKSGDTGPVSIQRPPTVLITTPESTDSLLTRAPRLLTSLRAVVLDEIHLFAESVRGDHLLCLLRRIEQIRRYHQQQSGADGLPLQRLALSATVSDPARIAARYLVPPLPAADGARDQEIGRVSIVQVGGGRQLQAEIAPMTGLSDLVAGLARRASSALSVRKSLVFCNTRNEVEEAASALRQALPYAAAIFVHYSNLDAAVRREVEEQFAQATVAVCVSSSTLELGIDIGSIDDVVLVGPPPTLTSFLQRLGRGGRRSGVTHVLCLARSPLEEIRFRALIEMAEAGHSGALSRIAHPAFPDTPPFRPSVLVQQLFSLLKQSPTGAVRLADLRRIAPLEFDDAALTQLLDHLTRTDYLWPGRLGEWRPGPALAELVDAHEIYSNIGSDLLSLWVVDAYSGRTMAQTDGSRLRGDTLLLGGRVMEVVWRDRYRVGVRWEPGAPVEELLRAPGAPFAVPYEVCQAVAAYLHLAQGQICLVLGENTTWLFHFWGDLYGHLLATILRAQAFEGEEEIVTPINEHCLSLPEALLQLPAWDARVVRRGLGALLPRIEPFLELGRFHGLLPPQLAHPAVVALCNLPRFEQIYRSATLVTPSPGLRSRLLQLVG